MWLKLDSVLALKNCKAKVPRALAGRWGSVHAVEARLMGAPQQFKVVFTAAMKKFYVGEAEHQQGQALP